MTDQEKQALIWRCRDAVAHLKQVVEVGVRGGRYSVTEYRYQLMINEIALASLTAPPVKLPPKSDVKMGGDVKTRSLLTGMNMMRKSCAEAIRAAGYEVEE